MKCAILVLLLVGCVWWQQGTAFEIVESTITEIREAFERGSLSSCTELITLQAEQIDSYEGLLNALVSYDRSSALAQAAVLDSELAPYQALNSSSAFAKLWLRQPLFCVPVAVKDNYNYVDRHSPLLFPTTVGSISLADNYANGNAVLVERLLRAGAVIIAKTNLAEFAFDGSNTNSTIAGQTRNAYNLNVTPFGSSGGSATAAAASFCVVSLGSDTQGSIQNPASAQSLFALRSTFDMVPPQGIFPLVDLQDVAGPFARNPMDLAIVMEALTRYPMPGSLFPVENRYTKSVTAGSLQGFKFGYLPSPKYSQDVNNMTQQAINHIRSLGGQVEILDDNIQTELLVFDLGNPLKLNQCATSSQASSWGAFLANHTTSSSPAHSTAQLVALLHQHPSEPASVIDIVTNIANAQPAYPATTQPACIAFKNWKISFAHRLENLMLSFGLDALLYPTMSGPPSPLGQPIPQLYSYFAAATGNPVIVFPGGYSSEGLPLGLTLLARPYQEPLLIQWASAISLNYPVRKPPNLASLF